VEAQSGAPAQRVFGGVRVTDDADVGFRLEEVDKATSYGLVIVEQEHAHRVSPPVAPGPTGPGHHYDIASGHRTAVW
jgi:hypothetical protein